MLKSTRKPVSERVPRIRSAFAAPSGFVAAARPKTAEPTHATSPKPVVEAVRKAA